MFDLVLSYHPLSACRAELYGDYLKLRPSSAMETATVRWRNVDLVSLKSTVRVRLNLYIE